ncbi:hypothetical protein FNV43_RR21053 [Rhamnella rubrinervis]|uniref:AAA+ ATPase domain-containing protein n=1 Tax=Rhamnella rubrinervis TaxID=2594499 RepID=A0A8K0DX50_9ROSA|nr:hypothetical protein FNV43_RR21053 [Rhamnella rubrinervis]
MGDSRSTWDDTLYGADKSHASDQRKHIMLTMLPLKLYVFIFMAIKSKTMRLRPQCPLGMGFLENLAGQFTETADEKLNKLKRKLEHLESKEHDVKIELEYAQQLSMKKPRKEVENWLQEVGRTITEVQDLEARIKEKSIFRHLTLRYSIDKYTAEVNELIQRGVFSGELTLHVCDSGVPLVTTELVGKKFQENQNMIWEKLMNDNISSVGVYGMGGVGKTTLIAHIHNQLLGHPSSSVAWVTVTQNCRTLKLQDDIAKVLGVGDLDGKDERKRAAVLASALLRKKKNFVLILDDVWDPIKLDEVGIPANEIRCKSIITTRSLDVCRMMNCKEIIKVEPLSQKDAWELFQMHLGHNSILPSQIEEIGKSLVNEFAGLPSGIILAAGCLRGWMTYVTDYKIYREQLIQYFIDEKLIHEMKTRRAELNRGHTILNKLENSCLLEGGDRFGRKYVKMHDAVRDMAIKIASMNSPRFLVGVEATDKLGDDKLMEDIVRMSLVVSKFYPGLLRNCVLLKHMSSLENLKALRRVEEFASLKKLETLRTSFRDLNDFNACVNSWKDGGPTDYSLSVRNDWFSFEAVELDCFVYLREDYGSGSSSGERSVILPNHIKSLRIKKLDNVDVVASVCDQRAFDLRKLVIKSCGGIKQLFPCSCFSVPAFQSLESLHLEDLQNLSDLVEVKRSTASLALHTATFSCLKKIELSFCHDIKRLFALALLYNLQKLECLVVLHCYKMVEIIEPFDELDPQETLSSISSTLPNLSRLHLSGLPELKIFCSNIKMDFPSLKDIYIKECPKLKRFPPLPPLPPSKKVAGTTFTMPKLKRLPKLKRFPPLPPVPPSKEIAGTTFTTKLKRFPPLPPLGTSKDVAGSTSTISLEGIEIDEQERAKWLSL